MWFTCSHGPGRLSVPVLAGSMTAPEGIQARLAGVVPQTPWTQQESFHETEYMHLGKRCLFPS